MIKPLPFLRLPMAFFLATFLCACLISLSAQAFQTDTSAYETQRLKINSLLTDRSNKFGQYDQSLNQRTGIFGFQSKQDIKNSNEILRQIVLNDNNIFKELKVLMDYKDLQVRQVRQDASTTNSRIKNYKQSIKKLQDQNEMMKKEASGLRSMNTLFIGLSIILLILFTGTIYLFSSKLKALRR